MMVGIKDKIKRWKDTQLMYLRKGIEVTEQMRAEKIRKKNINSVPGTIRYGLINKQDPVSFMKDCYARRKNQRQQKTKK